MSAEVWTLFTLVGGFLALAGIFKLPAALATAGASLLGLIVSGNFSSLYHLVEGAFGYFDAILIIGVAMIFMKTLEDSGILEEIARRMLVSFGDRPTPLAFISIFLVMLPGMLTGSSTAAALTTGKFVAPVLVSAGFSGIGAATLIAIGSVLGMVAPPVNIPAMIIGAGVDMPYIGFDIPLLVLTLPLAVFIALWSVSKCEWKEGVKKVPLANEETSSATEKLKGVSVYLPFVIVLALMILSRLAGGALDPGIPMLFVAGSLCSVICGNRFNVWNSVREGVKRALPTMGVLVGAGMIVQTMTLTGVRGLLVVSALDLPTEYLFITAALTVPLFGAISAFASSSIMGVPIVLALIGHGEIVTAAAITVMAALGDLIPPIALVPTVVSEMLGGGRGFRNSLLKECLLPATVVLVWSLIILWQAPVLARLLAL